MRSRHFRLRWYYLLGIGALATGLPVAVPDRAAAQWPEVCFPGAPAVAQPPALAADAAWPGGMASAVTQDPPTPVVSVRVRAPATQAAGQELEYRLTVENTSAAAAHHVMVRSPLPANTRFVRATPEPTAKDSEILWQLGTLEAGAKKDLTLVLAPTGGDEIKFCARVQFEHGQCVATKLIRPMLRLEKRGPTRAMVNDSLSYQLTVTNAGATELTNVLLTDILPAGLEHESRKERLSWIIGTLAAGQSQSVQYTVIARKAGQLRNRAIATAAGEVREEKESTVEVGVARLGVSMIGPNRRYVNTPATYHLRVRNEGTVALRNVVVSNPVPEHFTLQSASSAGQRSGNDLQWLIPELAPGAEQPLEVVMLAKSSGRWCNQASARAEGVEAGRAEACTDFLGQAALSLQIEDSADPVEVGASTSYTITVRNPGTTPAADVRVQATVPAQMTVLRAAGAAANEPLPNNAIAFAPVAIPAGGEAIYRIEVRADKPGDVRFKVSLTADVLRTGGPVEQEESTTIFAMLPTALRKPARILPGATTSRLPR